MKSSPKPSVIIFDINETLLDLSPLRKKVNSLLDSNKGFLLWFEMLLHHSLVANEIADYKDFITIGGATLEMAARVLETELDRGDKEKVASLFQKLPPHPDVEKGLQKLQAAGLRLATLTNATTATLTSQLAFAGLDDYFELSLSVDIIKKYKPSLETYRWAAAKMGVAPEQVIFVAAHGWDVAGAMQAGMQAAYIQRKGQSLYPLAPAPAFVEKDLVRVADSILKKYKLG